MFIIFISIFNDTFKKNFSNGYISKENILMWKFPPISEIYFWLTAHQVSIYTNGL